MIDTITSALQDSSMSIVALPLALALGAASAVASACCTMPAMSMLVAYSGTRRDRSRHAACVASLSFMAGTTVALMALGLIAGFLGQTARAALGTYWKLVAGVMAVVLGMAALHLLPVTLPHRAYPKDAPTAHYGMLGAVLTGVVLGGGVAAASLPCNPGMFIIIGASILMGHVLWGTLLMFVFAIGFSLPLGAILMGVSAGATAIKAQRAEAAIRTVAGILLTAAGLYLLITF